MWPLFLLVTALAAHAVLLAWLLRVFDLAWPRSPNARSAFMLVLAMGAVAASLSLFAPREWFGYTSFELMFVALGGALFVASSLLIVGLRRLRRSATGRSSSKERPSDASRTAPSTAAASADREEREHAKIAAPATDTKEDDVRTGRRDALVAMAGAVSWAGSGAILGWGAKRGRHEFELVETVVKIPGWPRVLDGYVIAQVSDLHVGEFVGEADLSRGLELVTRARPDLLVATGDLVDFDAGVAPMVAERLARLAPRDGIFAILGNHDYYADADTVRSALQRAGIDVLVDAHRLLRGGDGGGFELVGLDDLSAVKYGGRGPDLTKTLAATTERPKILLAHQPRQFDEAAGKVALQLSGHTHGLQFDFLARAGRIAHRYVSGAYEKDGSLLWVNRGFGVTGPPSRVGVRPEVTKIVLVSA